MNTKRGGFSDVWNAKVEKWVKDEEGLEDTLRDESGEEVPEEEPGRGSGVGLPIALPPCKHGGSPHQLHSFSILSITVNPWWDIGLGDCHRMPWIHVVTWHFHLKSLWLVITWSDLLWSIPPVKDKVSEEMGLIRSEEVIAVRLWRWVGRDGYFWSTCNTISKQRNVQLSRDCRLQSFISQGALCQGNSILHIH